MRRFRIGFLSGAIWMAALANGCFIGVDDFSKPCATATECPVVGGYLCASKTKWPQAVCDTDAGEDKIGPSADGGVRGCRCEVKFPPDAFDGGPVDGGGDAGPPYTDAGPPPDYCSEIRPILQAKCLYTCHSAQMGYTGSPKDFRLDYYDPPDSGGVNDGGLAFLPGVHEKAGRCYARILLNDMPPEQQTYPAYTALERQTFLRWLDAGVPFGNGNCEGPGPKDGGLDGGGDAGLTIHFAVDIQPIFTVTCALAGCHTGAAPTGGMNLSAGNSYNALVNVNTSAGCNSGGSKRVLAFDIHSSMLWQKLTPDGGYCNSSMPRNLVILRTQQPASFAKIEAWIGQGAANN